MRTRSSARPCRSSLASMQKYAPELLNEMMAAIPSNLSPRKRAARSLETGTILLTMLKAAKRRRLNDATHL